MSPFPKIGVGRCGLRISLFACGLGAGTTRNIQTGICVLLNRTFAWKLFRRVETTVAVAAVQKALDEILSTDEGIREKRWWTREEFNRTGR